MSCWQGETGGQGGTYDPEAVEGHVGMEALQVLQPPLVRVWVGEVCEGSEAGPDLRGHHKNTVSASRWFVGAATGNGVPQGCEHTEGPGVKQKINPGQLPQILGAAHSTSLLPPWYWEHRGAEDSPTG